MKKMNRISLLLLMLACSALLHAQDADEKGLGNTMRSNGKIYVVIAVALTILFGLILYVARLDRKLRKLERDN
jgi:hypothetical protein